jgi:kynurenine formamidase
VRNCVKAGRRTAALLAALGISPAAAAEPLVLDLTHAVPTFAAIGTDLNRPDGTRPFGESRPVPTFGEQAVLLLAPDSETGHGHFYAGRLGWSEHHGTHLDAPAHYRNDAASAESPDPDRRMTHQLEARDLVGPVVFLDIGARVQAQLDRNGGRPSPDRERTDFSAESGNVVTPSDIDSVRGALRDGSWLVVHAGWSRFFTGSSFETSPYVNGWNHPGFTPRACDRLIEIEEKRGIRINGLVMDNIGIDSGESSIGEGEFRKGFHCHVRGLQRGWKFVENATNLHRLREARPGSCTLVVGAPKHVAGSGGPSRVFALCEAR